MNRRAGFSLVEALIALIIAALVLMAIFELQRQLSHDQARYEEALAAAETRRNALVLLRGINPTEQPSGLMTLGGGRALRWTSAPIAPARQNVRYPAGLGDYEMRLWRLSVRVDDARGVAVDRFELDQLGWRRTVSEPAGGPASTGPARP